MEWFGDLFTLLLLGACVYAFVPAGVRASLRSGLGPAVSTIAEAIRTVLPIVEQIAYRVIVGKRREVSRVSTGTPLLSSSVEPEANVTEDAESAERTNERKRSVLFLAVERVQVDRSRSALIALLVEAGWQTVDIRNTLKGTASDLGDEIRAARAALASDADMLIVREGSNERLIVK